MKIKLTKAIKNELIRHAEEAYPEECCGFLFGKVLGEGRDEIRRVLGTKRVPNARENHCGRRFFIDPHDYRKAEGYAWQRGIDLLGVYHSHPDHPAEPSEHDRQSALPWFSYIIVSVSVKPVTGTNESATRTEKPATRTEKPATRTEKPATRTEKPVSGTEKPVSGTEKPATGTNESATRTDKSAAGPNEPAIEIRSWRLGEERSFTEEIVAVESVTNDIPQTSAKKKYNKTKNYRETDNNSESDSKKRKKNYSESENNKESENNSMTKL